MKKIFSILICVLLTVTLFGCGNKGNGATTDNNQSGSNMSNTSNEEIYFLNFKPEVATVYDKIAKTYKDETGVTVKVVTAASDTYEQTLTSEVAKKDAPTIFQINGPIGYQNWKNFCADLSDTKLYSYLTDKNLAIKEGSGVYGIPYVVESYGIIYNNAIMDKYFALKNRQKTVNSMDEIVNFSTLKTVVEDMTKLKNELGIDGVFASTSFSSGNQWRWQTHLANIPLYYEFSENNEYDDPTVAGLNTKEITFKYAQNYKNIFDLYINNSGTEKGLLGGKSVNDSTSEFALGKVAMMQNGTWTYNDIKGLAGNVVKADDIKMMPVYTDVKGEEKQGLCVGT
ncbi:MAG: ABC transporter substrate-binding protein, partial [Acutalibacteraceae bacterium]